MIQRVAANGDVRSHSFRHRAGQHFILKCDFKIDVKRSTPAAMRIEQVQLKAAPKRYEHRLGVSPRQSCSGCAHGWSSRESFTKTIQTTRLASRSIPPELADLSPLGGSGPGKTRPNFAPGS